MGAGVYVVVIRSVDGLDAYGPLGSHEAESLARRIRADRPKLDVDWYSLNDPATAMKRLTKPQAVPRG